MATVEIYSTQNCPYCLRAKQFFDAKKMCYEEIFVDENPDKLAEMLKRADNRKTIPQIFINDQGIGGFEELMRLEQSGELDELLKK